MTSIQWGVAAAVLVLLLLVLATRGGRGVASSASVIPPSEIEPKPAPSAAPAPIRRDLFYGYFGVWGNQVAETRDHTNMLYLWNQLSTEEVIEALKAHPTAIGVYDCGSRLFASGPRADARELLRDVFEQLRAAGVLDRIKLLLPGDEPNLPENAIMMEHIVWAANTMRAVAGEFQELDGVKLGCMYAGSAALQTEHLELWDVVLADDYDRKEQAVAPGNLYDQILARLSPHQMVGICPGPSWSTGQDPAPFLAYANANSRVWGIVPFMWADYPGVTGVRSLPQRDAYVAAGKVVTTAICPV